MFSLQKYPLICRLYMGINLHRFLGLMLILGQAVGIELHAQETSPAPQQHIEITGSHTFRITYDSSFTWPEGGGYSAVFHLPIPPETGAQHIEHFTSTLKGTTETYDNESPPHKLLTATIHHKSGEERKVHWQVEIIGQFQTRQLVDGPPSANAAPIVPPAPGEFLGTTESLNWKSDVFQSWLDSAGLRRTANESAVAYGQRFYSYLKAHGNYSYPPGSAWNTAAVCHHLGTDCGGFSTVFAAACRANKIPARMMVGQWFISPYKLHRMALLSEIDRGTSIAMSSCTGVL